MSRLFPNPGEWVCFRGNQRLDAHSQAVGHITKPSIAWKHYVGRVETILVVEPEIGPASVNDSVTVPGEESPGNLAEVGDPRWGLLSPLRQVAGSAKPLARNFFTDYAAVLPGVPGVQKFEFESAFAKPTINGWYDVCVGRCFAWQDGEWVKVWETEPLSVLFQPLPVIGDFDADGELEIAILPWKELFILDARTGKIKDRCYFTDGRNYGFFGVYDVDGDGKSEFLIQSDFSKHVEMLGYRDGKLHLLWQKEIETDISDPQIVMRVNPNPVGDFDGDGKLEVLLHLWNGSGDGRWHITLLDAMTGALLTDLVDQRLYGVADIDGDGKTELLTVRAEGYLVPDYGTIGVFGLQEGEFKPLWTQEDAGWQLWYPPYAANVNSTAFVGRQTVLQRPGAAGTYFIFRQRDRRRANSQLLSLALWGDAGPRLLTQVSGEELEAYAVDLNGNMLLRCTTQPGQSSEIQVTSGRARLLSSQPTGVEANGVEANTVTVAWPTGARQPTIVVQGHGEELVAFEPPQQGQEVAKMRRWQGREQHVSWPLVAKSVIGDLLDDLVFPPKSLEMALTYAGPVLTDLFGDGRRQVLYATASPSGCGQLIAAGLDGRELWRHDFPAFPGGAPVASIGGVILWQTGHFTDARRRDVLVTTRRSAMHSEETFLLCGEDGRELWHRNRQTLPGQNRAVGGVPFAIADLDGDGLDDVVSFHPSVFYILQGDSGENVIARNTRWESVPGNAVYWGIPIPGDFEGNGVPSVLFATDRMTMTGLVRLDGTLAWFDALDKSPKQLPAIGDFDGDGALEVVGIGYEDGIHCYNAATGALKWQLATPTTNIPAGIASADINGDGRDEAIFVVGKTLYCVGASIDGSSGDYLWQLELPCRVGPPSVALLDQEQGASIVVMGEDGYVYCVQ